MKLLLKLLIYFIGLSTAIFLVFSLISYNSETGQGAIIIILMCLMLIWIFIQSLSIRRLQKQLRGSNHTTESLKSLVSTSKDAWSLWDVEGNFIDCSDSFRTFLNLTNSRFITFSDVASAFSSFDSVALKSNFSCLIASGTTFETVIVATESRMVLEIFGKISIFGESDVVCIWVRDATTASQGTNQLKVQLSSVTQEKDRLLKILDNLPIPAWYRNSDLRLEFCNKEYAKIVEATRERVLMEDIQLIAGSLFGQGRSLAENVKKTGIKQAIRQHVVIDGVRSNLEITELPIGTDFIGYALDSTKENEMLSELDRHVTAHGEVLELLSTSIAIFGSDTRLKFFNAAYKQLTTIEENWLHTNPTYGEVLEELRNRRMLPECADFPAYKRERISLFTSVISPMQELMHLPDGKTIRSVIAPHPFGGLLFLYEDVTVSLSLERQYNTLMAVQKEVLENLYEGIAVFSSDNRLRLSNLACGKLWGLSPEQRSNGQHISTVVDLIRPYFDYGDDWEPFKENVISNLTDRIPKTGRLIRKDDVVINFSYVPLPDGAHMHSYIDITDTCKVEKALLERNQALESADKLKIEFVANASSEFKEPINIITGLADLLKTKHYGELNEKQIEYLQGITDASNQLLYLISGLLDLASIEAGVFSLKIVPIDLRNLTESCISMVSKKANDKELEIKFRCQPSVQTLFADERCIKQVLYSLLTNSIKSSMLSGIINVLIEQEDEYIKLSVSDSGIGDPTEKQKKILHRTDNESQFFSAINVNLPLVKRFIELHGGTVKIESEIDTGTTVECRIPIRPYESLAA